MSIAPVKKVPLQRVINQLLDNIQDRLSDCRQRWWVTNQTACLINQWVLVVGDGTVKLLSAQAPWAKQIADARYDPAAERLLMSFRDSTTTNVNVRP
jgi:hypothetical protein